MPSNVNQRLGESLMRGHASSHERARRWHRSAAAMSAPRRHAALASCASIPRLRSLHCFTNDTSPKLCPG
eukprot:CAMPEP_0202855352 /NCGR_PEP_ID=MMETSP1389-20130828/91469_1 /ASSEMBLY_ACC=CAM_ASM_000865 /TAXON_ID=302021 /ORGANISM="Rhodomonas sp., Strain CCMP768" /LENGTH=69 /DNA_ID=CAMNT_0049533961 /DNA_START=649 /DNA_END=854 /DNA_ORIENTATION=+